MLVNIDHLTKLTGSTRRTILNKCTDLIAVEGKGREHLYESKDALPLILGLHKAGEKNKTLESERTKLASAQAEKCELEVEVIKGNLIPAEHVQEVVDTMLASFRARLLSLPTKAAHAVLPLTDQAEAEDVLREYVYEALQELSDYDSKKYCALDGGKIRKTAGTSTPPDGKSVGRFKKETVKRSKQRTRTVEH